MKTNFLPRNRHKHAKRREIVLVAVVLAAVMLFFALFGSRVAGLFGPLWHSNVFMRAGITNIVESLRSKDALIAENAQLKSDIVADEELITSLRSIASSRDELLSQFGRMPVHMTPAGVLVHPPETPYDVLVVDAGENLGVKQGSLVFTSAGSLIGTVSEVFSKTSQIKLYSSAGERTDAVLERGNNAVTLIGRGGGSMEFTLPRDTDVTAGDRILSPRLDAPLMGVVSDIEVTPTDSFKTILVQSPVNPSEVRFVMIQNE